MVSTNIITKIAITETTYPSINIELTYKRSDTQYETHCFFIKRANIGDIGISGTDTPSLVLVWELLQQVLSIHKKPDMVHFDDYLDLH